MHLLRARFIDILHILVKLGYLQLGWSWLILIGTLWTFGIGALWREKAPDQEAAGL